MKKTNERLQRIIFFIAGALISFAAVRIYDAHMEAIEWRDKQVGMYISPFVAEIKQSEAISEPEIDINEVVRRVRILESSNGSAGFALTCKRLGLSNDYGYGLPHCFDSHEEATATVEDWFERKLKIMSLEESLCYYQSGYIVEDCEYYQKYLRLQE